MMTIKLNYISVHMVRFSASMQIDENTERWVQCHKCHKWRCVPEESTMKLPRSNWHCALNVFSNKYNNCSAEQEKMPPRKGGRQRTASEETTALLEGLGLKVHEEDTVESLFTLSECTCHTCTEMNAAAREWANVIREPHRIPLLQCVLRTITATSRMAEAMEEEKRFAYRPDDLAVPSTI